jgi:hypothetical protein
LFEEEAGMGTHMAHIDKVLAEVAETADATEVATYIGSIVRELRDMATRHDLDFLAYLLAMTADEAGAVASGANRHQATDAT